MMINKLKKYFSIPVCLILSTIFMRSVRAADIFTKQGNEIYVRHFNGVVFTTLDSLAAQNVHTVMNVKLKLSKSDSITIDPFLLEFYPDLNDQKGLAKLIDALTGTFEYYVIDSIVAREINETEEFGIISLDIIVTKQGFTQAGRSCSPMINFRDNWSAEQLLAY